MTGTDTNATAQAPDDGVMTAMITEWDSFVEVALNPHGAWQAIQTLQAALDRAEAERVWFAGILQAIIDNGDWWAVQRAKTALSALDRAIPNPPALPSSQGVTIPLDLSTTDL